MKKYVVIAEDESIKNLKPFEDAIGKFFVCKDENCESDEWFALYVEEDNEGGKNEKNLNY